MNETRFTERAQAALRLAQEGSAELGHGYVGSEHLLLGLAREGKGVAARVLQAAGVEPEACTVFDDSLSACRGARAAKMRVVGVYDPFFARDEGAMRGFCDVYIKSFQELLWMPEQREEQRRRRS